MAKQTDFAGKRHTLTLEDQRKGGKRSGEVRRDLRDTRELVRKAMSMYLNSEKKHIRQRSNDIRAAQPGDERRHNGI